MTARPIKLDSNGRMELSKRTLAEVWRLTLGSAQPSSPGNEPAPKPEPPRIPFAGRDPKERQFR